MNKIKKFILKVSIPILLAILMIIIVPKNDKPIYRIISLIILIFFIGAFINIFVQAHKLDKKAKKDPELKKIINKKIVRYRSSNTFYANAVESLLWAVEKVSNWIKPKK